MSAPVKAMAAGVWATGGAGVTGAAVAGALAGTKTVTVTVLVSQVAVEQPGVPTFVKRRS